MEKSTIRYIVLFLLCNLANMVIAEAADLDPNRQFFLSSSFHSTYRKIQDRYYQRGVKAKDNAEIQKAITYFQFAAKLGSVAANWQLARLYSEGQGIAKNFTKAIHYYKAVIASGIEPDSKEEHYVSDALLKLGDYFYDGEGADLRQARYYYFQAATNFANPEAQYCLGLILLKGKATQKEKLLAARWLQLAAQKGNIPAEAVLGNLLFKEGDTSYGVALLMDAYQKASFADKLWIKVLRDHSLTFIDKENWSLALDIKRQLEQKKPLFIPF